jgi:hypothetical protein
LVAQPAIPSAETARIAGAIAINFLIPFLHHSRSCTP